MCNIEKRTLCRPITFYNDYMPVFGEGSKAEFSAFGIVDGVQVGDILLNDDNAGVLQIAYGNHKSSLIMSMKTVIALIEYIL